MIKLVNVADLEHEDRPDADLTNQFNAEGFKDQPYIVVEGTKVINGHRRVSSIKAMTTPPTVIKVDYYDSLNPEQRNELRLDH